MKRRCENRMTGKWLARMLMLSLILGMFLLEPRESVMAESWHDAYEFHQMYGSRVPFFPVSQSDGNIYFGTKGALTASAGIRYRTIGWKISVKNQGGSVLQTMYCKLDGRYLNCEQQTDIYGYAYKVYGIALSTIRGRMTDTVRTIFERGNCSLIFDACMVVVKNGIEQGGMTDDGPSWGNVYTTYEGIVHAQRWGSASQTALHSFFDKSVEGLYYSVDVNASNGIDSVSGAGSYCYGTYAQISAKAERGYRFSYWSGTNVTYDNPHGFYVNGNYSWTAHAVPQELNVVFHRNFNDADSVKATKSYTYGNENQQLINFGWMKEGYYPVGWSENRYSSTCQYFLTSAVSSQWIAEKYPEIHLYEIWKENEYTIIFDGNGAEEGIMNSVHTSYTGSFCVPENSFINRNKKCTFVGWSLNPAATGGDYTKGNVVQVRDLVKSLGLEHTTGAVIYLYAIWDEAPAIQAPDLYFSLLDARQGKISEEVLAGYAKAVDLEDGVIPYGKNPKNAFLLIDYDAQKFLNCTTSTEIPVTFQATDCSGNTVERSIVIHIADTEVKDGTEEMGKSRLISQKYFENERGELLSEQEGGIRESSRWRCDEKWRSFLEDTLRRAE